MRTLFATLSLFVFVSLSAAADPAPVVTDKPMPLPVRVPNPDYHWYMPWRDSTKEPSSAQLDQVQASLDEAKAKAKVENEAKEKAFRAERAAEKVKEAAKMVYQKHYTVGAGEHVVYLIPVTVNTTAQNWRGSVDYTLTVPVQVTYKFKKGYSGNEPGAVVLGSFETKLGDFTETADFHGWFFSQWSDRASEDGCRDLALRLLNLQAKELAERYAEDHLQEITTYVPKDQLSKAR